MGIREAIRSTDLGDGATTVAVLLHGYGSDERDLAGLAAFLPTGMPWVSVRAPLRHPAFGYAWYSLETGDFAPPGLVATATDTLWSWIDSALPANAALVPLGFSQGGLMATQLLRTRPERVAAAVILSGFIAGASHTPDATLAQSRPPVFWGRGDADPLVPPDAIDAVRAWLPEHSTLEEHVYPGLGHSISDAELVHVRDFLVRNLEPRPEP